MLELRKFVAPEFIFGPEALQLTERYLSNFGARKVLIVTDPGVISAGWVDKISQEIIKLNPNAKVIICTGFSELLNEQSAISIGAKSFVMKPLIRAVIAQLVRETLDE